jgi:hypothetical protein
VTIDFIAGVPDYCADEYRFRRQGDLQQLFDLLQFPPRLQMSNGSKIESETAFLYVLTRLITDEDVDRLIKSGFGGEKTKWGRVLTTTTDWLLEHHGHRLSTIQPEAVDRFPLYASAVEKLANSKGATFLQGACAVALFIDCNCVATSRPAGGPAAPGVGAPRNDPLIQRAFYNGWKHLHGLKVRATETFFLF